MYRIRSASGAEAVYNSLEEFHAAVRRGEVHQEDEIFHTRANRWLDVKSHPHYRSAVGWNGGGEHHPLPPAAPPATTVRPASAAPARAESSHAVPQQTVVRPQLVADRPAPRPAAQAPAAPQAAAPAPAPAGPPRKSRELVFVDLGDPKPAAPPKQNVTIIEAQKPAAVTVQKPAPPQPLATGNTDRGTELGFLVMDGGIESPVRNSAGHRIVPEDLNLLFDAPMPAGKAPAGGVATAAPPAPPAPPKTSSPARPATPAPEPPPAPRTPAPAPAPVAKVSSPSVEPVKPAAPAPAVTEARPAAAKVAPPVAPPAPAPIPAAVPEPVQPVAAQAAPAPAPAPVAPAPAPAPVAAVIPPAPVVEDLDIPGEELVAAHAAPIEAPALEAALPARPSAPRSARKGMLVGAGAFIIVMGVAVAAWKPWLRRAPTPALAAQPAAESAAPAPVSGGPAPSESTPPVTRGGAATPAPGGSTRPTETAAAREDSVKPPRDEIIAAARPTFQGGVDVNAASLSIGADIPGVPSTSPAPTELIRRLEQAERQAQRDLTARLGSFRAVLSPELISNSDGAGRARSAWSGGAEAIRQYRARIARLEQAYQDSVLASQRAERWPTEELRAWSARTSAVEPAETTQLADLMIAQVNEGLDLLAGLGGGYSIKGARISFSNAGSAPRYLSIRSWVDQRMSAWRATPESARPLTLSLLLTALGDGFPAVQ